MDTGNILIISLRTVTTYSVQLRQNPYNAHANVALMPNKVRHGQYVLGSDQHKGKQNILSLATLRGIAVIIVNAGVRQL